MVMFIKVYLAQILMYVVLMFIENAKMLRKKPNNKNVCC